jgi:hypothetical protein
MDLQERVLAACRAAHVAEDDFDDDVPEILRGPDITEVSPAFPLGGCRCKAPRLNCTIANYVCMQVVIALMTIVKDGLVLDMRRAAASLVAAAFAERSSDIKEETVTQVKHEVLDLLSGNDHAFASTAQQLAGRIAVAIAGSGCTGWPAILTKCHDLIMSGANHANCLAGMSILQHIFRSRPEILEDHIDAIVRAVGGFLRPETSAATRREAFGFILVFLRQAGITHEEAFAEVHDDLLGFIEDTCVEAVRDSYFNHVEVLVQFLSEAMDDAHESKASKVLAPLMIEVLTPLMIALNGGTAALPAALDFLQSFWRAGVLLKHLKKNADAHKSLLLFTHAVVVRSLKDTTEKEYVHPPHFNNACMMLIILEHTCAEPSICPPFGIPRHLSTSMQCHHQ